MEDWLKTKLAIAAQARTDGARSYARKRRRACFPASSLAGVLFISMIFVRMACAQPPLCDPPPTGIISWWPGDGNANDLVSTNNGALEGGAIATATGLVGQAFSFDGTNGYVQIPDAPALQPANFTLEAWVNFSSLNSAGSGGSPAGDQYIVFKQNTQVDNFEGICLMKTRAGAGDVFEAVVSSTNGQTAAITSATTISTGVWYHIAAARGSNFLQLYVNGQLQGQTNVAFAQNYGALPLYFGTTGESYWDRKFAGLLDEVTLYSRALASNEIYAIYAAGAAGKCKSDISPVITSQPQSQAVTNGGTAQISVAANGSPPLYYQWQFSGGSIAAVATNATLTLANFQSSEAGNYTVIVSNSIASVTSAVAALTVLVPPVILTQPSSRTVPPGTNVTFNVSASGTPPLLYQWEFDGAPLAGATNASLAISNVQPAAVGNYTVIVADADAAVTSAVAVLTVSGPPVIVVPPASQSVMAGTNVTLAASVSGSPPFAFEWNFNGTNLPGATSSHLTITNAQPANSGNYFVIVENLLGATNSSSSPASLTVAPAPGTVMINGGITYQVIDGFGADINHRSWNSNELQPVLDALINQAGMTLFEVVFDNINWEVTNDNNNANVMNWDYYTNVYNSSDFQKLWGIIRYLNQQGITNGVIPDFQGPLPLWMGGLWLTDGMENEYAETIASALVYARSNQNLQFSTVEAINEPDIFYEGPHMLYPSQYITVMEDLAQQLATNGMGDVQFSGPDLATTSQFWLNEMMTYPSLMAKYAHFGLHSYENETVDASGVAQFIQGSPYPNLHFWMTEYNVWCQSCVNGTSGNNTWTNALGMASFLLDLLGEGASAGIVWEGYDSVYYQYNTNNGLNGPGLWSFWGLFAVNDTNASPLTYSPRPAFYTISQITAYVRPGAQQIDVDSSASPLTPLAFYNPHNGQFTLTGVNTNSTPVFLPCAMVSLPSIPSLNFYYTTSSTNLAYGGSVPVTNGAFALNIPADCVFTLTYQYAPPPPSPPPVPAPYSLTPYLQNGNLFLSVYAQSGCTCQIQASSDLVNWQTMTNIVCTNAVIQFSDPNAGNSSRRFYRAVWIN